MKDPATHAEARVPPRGDMIRRIVTVLALLVPCITIAATTAQPVQAKISDQQSASATAAARLISGFNGTLFTNAQPSNNCTNQNFGTCWWWTAIALNSLITYAENHPGCSVCGTIRDDLTDVYQAECISTNPCPSAPDDTLYAGRFTENTKGNASFDDIGWWTQMWINAYRWTQSTGTTDSRYLYLAEALWYYTTRKGWDPQCGGLMQIKYGRSARNPQRAMLFRVA